MTQSKGKPIVIAAPNFQAAAFTIVGDAPYVQNRFSRKAQDLMEEGQKEGEAGKKGKKRAPKDFEASYEEAKHISREGWLGIPAAAFRKASISACRIVGFQMTLAKLSIFVEADGFDEDDGNPLVRITEGEPHINKQRVSVGMNKTDIRWRPMWDAGWKTVVRIRFDADQFTLTDITNLIVHVGMQVGIGEGRPDSKMSAGMGWGTFVVEKVVPLNVSIFSEATKG